MKGTLAVQEVGFFSFFRAIAKFSVLEIISQLWFSLIKVGFLWYFFLGKNDFGGKGVFDVDFAGFQGCLP